MKKNRFIAICVLVIMLVLSGCSNEVTENPTGNSENLVGSSTETGGDTGDKEKEQPQENGKKDNNGGEKADKPQQNPADSGKEQEPEDLGTEEETYGEDISEALYAGYSADAATDLSGVVVTCISGSEGCYSVIGNTLTFTKMSADSVYSVSGEFKGNIIIDVGDDYKFDLELHGLSVSSDTVNPVVVKSGDWVTLTAKKGYQNYIYDMRAAVNEEDSDAKSGAVYSEVDLRIAGKGELVVVSENNNGIHTKKDLEVKNLTLTVFCEDNALKGNDSVTLEKATATLIAAAGDGVKTSNSDISSKGNQRGIITVLGGNYTVYAACDGLDAAYDVVVEDGEEVSTVLNIFTDKYSNYSEEVTAVAEDVNYIRFTSDDWKYSVKYYNAEDDFVWVNPEYHSKVSGGRTTYYYYSFPKLENYSKFQYFIYSDDMKQGQEEEYLAMTDYLSVNTEYDTFALTVQNNSMSYSWTNYTTQINEGFGGGRGGFGGGPGGFGGGPGGFGGFGEGNSEKGEYSTKGIKAANEIVVNSGTINIKAYDDAIHANNDSALENGGTPKGNVTINGGVLSLFSNDDGLHADGTVTIANGTVNVSNSYEGIEGTYVTVSGGQITVNAKDDGINATTNTGMAVTISGGELYILCTGDGIDSNSRASYEGIVFSGGDTLVISNSGMNSAIDSEQGYKYEGGRVVAVMPSGGMSNEAVHCKNFSEIGSKQTIGLIVGRYATVKADGETVMTFRIPIGLNGMVVYLGSKDASVSVTAESSETLDSNGVCWYK